MDEVLEPVRLPGDRPDQVGATLLHAERVVGVVGQRGERRGRRRQSHAGRPRSVLAVASDQGDPGPPGLRADHLLLEDRRHEGLEDDPRAADPQASQPLDRRRDRPMDRHQRRRVVVRPDQPAGARQRPRGPGPQARARTAPPWASRNSVTGPSGVRDERHADPDASKRSVGSPGPRRWIPSVRRRSSGGATWIDSSPSGALGERQPSRRRHPPSLDRPVADTPVSLPSTDTVRTRLFVAAPALIAAAALVTFADPAITAPGTARTIEAAAFRPLAIDRPMPR